MARSFIFGEGQEYKTPAELAKARAVANAMLLNREAPKDVGSGINAIAQALMYRSMMGDIGASEKAGQESAAAAFNPVLGALGGSGAFPPAPGGSKVADALAGKPNSDSPNGNYRDAIASIESAGSGDYGAIGPTHKKLGRALGRYQVMEANVGPWSKEALGREVTPDEFLRDPSIQDAVFDHRFGGYVQKYGNPQDAASAWFTGKPLAQGANRRDVLGTTGSAYVSKFSRALGDQPAVAAVNRMTNSQPVQVASLDPSAGLPAADPYALVPAADTRGEDQRAKFRAWNSDPAGNNAANMAGIDPALQKVVQRAKEIAGTDFVIGSGRRDDAQQKQAMQFGWSGTMKSDHLGGGAADLWAVTNGKVDFDPAKQRAIIGAMKQAAGELGVDLEAGADWRKPDMPHFGMVGQTPLDNAPVPTPRPGPGMQVASLDPSIGLPEQQQAAPQLPAPRMVQDRPIANMSTAAQQAPEVPQAPAQVAQAGQFDQSRLPAAAGGTADTFDASGGPSMQMLMNAANQPFLNENQSAMVNALMQQKLAEQDPLRQLQLRKLQQELGRYPKNWQKLDDNTLYDATSGEIKRIGGDQASGPFKGNSVEAQALNGLVKNNQLTTEQAYQLAAGKPVTDPSTGALIFMTPQGIFGQPAQGGPAVPLTPNGSGGSQLFAPAPLGGAQPAAPGGTPTQAPTGQRQGMIQLTDPKATKPTETQRNRVSNVNQAFDAINGELDRYSELVKNNGIEVMPGAGKDNLNAVRQGIMLQMKELFNLGVLNGPDLSLMERMIYDPVVDVTKEGGLVNLPSQMWTGMTGGADDRAKNSVTELKRMLTNIKQSAAQSIATPGQTQTPPPQADGVTDWRKYFGERNNA